MRWSDIPSNPTNRVLRQFAAAWLVFLTGGGALQYWLRGHHQLGIGMVCAGVVFGVLGLIKPSAIQLLFKGCMWLAFPIGWVISQLMLLIMFYGLVTPVAWLFRIRGRDLLSRKPAPDRVTFWVPNEAPGDVRSYFRQY
jgi:hypothetical protein